MARIGSIGGALGATALLMLATGVGISPDRSGVAQAAAAQATKPFLVKIHADWCGTCTRLLPLWDRLEARYGSTTRMVVFDVTNRVAVERSRREAERLGLREFFDAHKSRTGTVAILDGQSHEPITVFYGEMDLGAYELALRKIGVERSS